MDVATSHSRWSLAVVGSRSFDDYPLLMETLDALRRGGPNVDQTPPCSETAGSGERVEGTAPATEGNDHPAPQGNDHPAARLRIVSGGARGADRLAERYARERGIEIVVFRPDWAAHGLRAGKVRNQTIVDACDALIAFWDGQSTGTAHSISLAKRANKPVRVVSWPAPGAEER